ncbi:MAG: C-GCAxxG-C-C family protein [Pseudomonadota bacterium]
MSRSQQARAMFGPQHSCAQAIVASFGPGLGLDEALALRLSRGLGMGMAQGLTCGAVSGALLVLGLAQGPRQDQEREPRYACYEAVENFCQRFQDIHGSIACRDLLGVDLGTPQGRQAAQEGGLFMSRCPGLVESAGLILEEML